MATPALGHDSGLVPNNWNDDDAPGGGVEELVYASNLLGSDERVTNFGGGNTSSKITMPDPLTMRPVEVLWVKASGGDLGSATRSGFASLQLDKVLSLEKLFKAHSMNEDDIVPLYPQCVFDLNPAPPSIDTPLHAFVPRKAVSHMHSDSVIAIAASEDCEDLTIEVFGGELGYLPWKRPGFELGLMLRDMVNANPDLKGAMMRSHGFICWADTWRECYDLTIGLINRATSFIEAKKGKAHPFGEVIIKGEEQADRTLLTLLPELRGKVAFEGQRLIASVDRTEPVLDFLSRSKMHELAQLGTSCPDHFLRTKIRPLVLDPGKGVEGIEPALAQFRETYKDYYRHCSEPDSAPMRNPNPSVVLLPGVGMVSFGKNASEARVTGRFYRNAIEVMRGAETISRYRALPDKEAFNIEYWALEEAKLRRMAPEKELSRRVAVITGGGSGIGLATALKMAALGAHIVLLDIDEDRLEKSRTAVQSASGVPGAVNGLLCNVTDAGALSKAFEQAVLTFGGVDIAIINAGNARRGSVADTSAEDYGFLSDLLMRAYFDTMAEACRVMVRQGTGGAIVVVGSKNGVAAGSNAAVYSAAKAFELHLMRVTAADFAKHGIRCNAINPDGVVTGSAIWSQTWKDQTAKSLGIQAEELVDYYAKRSLLGAVVSPDDCAEAICWLASDRSSRTTGAIIPVDGGNKEGFLR